MRGHRFIDTVQKAQDSPVPEIETLGLTEPEPELCLGLAVALPPEQSVVSWGPSCKSVGCAKNVCGEQGCGTRRLVCLYRGVAAADSGASENVGPRY